MAWVKVTSHGDKRKFWINTDKLALIERREGWLYTVLYEPGDDGDQYKVEETPEEIIYSDSTYHRPMYYVTNIDLVK